MTRGLAMATVIDLNPVIGFLQQMSETGNVTQIRYQRERPSHLPHPTSLRNAGYSWNGVLELAGLPVRWRPSRFTMPEEDVAAQRESRETQRWHRDGLPVVEATLRRQIRRVILPGGSVGSFEEEIVSLR